MRCEKINKHGERDGWSKKKKKTDDPEKRELRAVAVEGSVVSFNTVTDKRRRRR